MVSSTGGKKKAVCSSSPQSPPPPPKPGLNLDKPFFHFVISLIICQKNIALFKTQIPGEFGCDLKAILAPELLTEAFRFSTAPPPLMKKSKLQS